MDIKITMLNGASRLLRVQPDTTVKSLKTLISEHFEVPTVKQRLSYGNGQTNSLDDDSKPLSSYGLQSGSVVWVLVTEPAPIQVVLKNEKGQTSTYDITAGETVSQFKLKVKNEEGVSEDQQRLIHEGKQMDDLRKLEDYNVRAGSIIYLTLRLRGG